MKKKSTPKSPKPLFSVVSPEDLFLTSEKAANEDAKDRASGKYPQAAFVIKVIRRFTPGLTQVLPPPVMEEY